MQVPDAFILRLLHSSLHELGFSGVADQLLQQAQTLGVLGAPTELANSSRKLKLFDWLSKQLYAGHYSLVLAYLDQNLQNYVTEGPISDVESRPNLAEVLAVRADKEDLIAVVLTVIYLVKRTQWLEQLVCPDAVADAGSGQDAATAMDSSPIGSANSQIGTLDAQTGNHAANHAASQSSSFDSTASNIGSTSIAASAITAVGVSEPVSDGPIAAIANELTPILDSIPHRPILSQLFHSETLQRLTREAESARLLSLAMLPHTDALSAVFCKDTLFTAVTLQSHSPQYLVQKLRQTLVHHALGQLWARDFYQGAVPYLEFEVPADFLRQLVVSYADSCNQQAPHHLPLRVPPGAVKSGAARGSSGPTEFVVPSPALDDFYRPKFPTALLHTRTNHSGQVWSSKFSPLGRYLLTGGADGQLLIYDVLNRFEVIQVLSSDNSMDRECFVNSPYKTSTASRAIIYCAWDRNEDYIVTGSLDTRVRVWSVKGIKRRRRTRSDSHDDDVKLLCCFTLGELIRAWTCEFLPVNTPVPQFIIGSPDKVLKAYDIYGYELYDFYSNPDSESSDRENVLMREDDEYEDNEPDVDPSLRRASRQRTSSATARDSGSITPAVIPQTTTLAPEPLEDLQDRSNKFNRINYLCITPNGKVLITINVNKLLVFYTIPDLQNVESVTRKLATLTLYGRLTSCLVSSNGKYLLLSMAPDELQIWDIENILETGKPILYRKLVGHSQGTYMLRSCFGYLDLNTEQEQLALSGSDDGDVYIWKVDSGRLVTRVKGHDEVCNAVSWNTGYVPNGGRDYGQLWCSVGDDKLVKIWGPPDFYTRD